MNYYFFVVALYIGLGLGYFATVVDTNTPCSPLVRVSFACGWLLLFIIGLLLTRFWYSKIRTVTVVISMLIVVAVSLPPLRGIRKSPIKQRLVNFTYLKVGPYAHNDVSESKIMRRVRHKAVPHIGMFAILGLLVYLASYRHRQEAGIEGKKNVYLVRNRQIKDRVLLIQTVVGLLLFAAGTEVLQFTIRERSPGVVDFSINIIGIGIGVISIPAINFCKNTFIYSKNKFLRQHQ